LRSELDPTMTGARNPNIFKEASAARAMAKAKGLNAAQTERLVLEATVKATRDAKGQRSSDTSMERAPAAPDLPSSTPPSAPTLPPAPEISPITDASKKAASVEAQAAYERFLGLTEDGGEAEVVPVPIPSGGGGGGKQQSPPDISSSGDSVNSYYKAQVMGHMYKFG